MAQDELVSNDRPGFPARSYVVVPSTDIEEGSIDLGTLLRILRRGLWLILFVAALTTGIAVVYALLTPPVFESSSSILIDPREKRTVDTEVVPSGLGTSIGENLALVDSQVKVILSDAVLRPVVVKLNLATNPEFGAKPPTVLQRVTGFFSLSKPSGAERSPEDKALVALYEHLKVARQEQTYVIDITAHAESAELAARIAQTTAESYLADQSKDKIETTERVSTLMDGQLAALRDRLREAETKVQDFRAENDLQEADGELVTAQQMLDLNAELAAAKANVAETAAKAQEIDQLRKAGINLDTIGDVVESQTITRLREQYATSSRREAIYSTTLLPSHPAMQQVRSEVRRLDGLIRMEVDRIWKSATLNHKMAERQLAETEAAIVAARSEINSNDSARIKLRELTREAETTRAVYESFLGRVKEMNEAQEIYTPDARVISPAATPIYPIWPKRKLIVALGLLFGCGLGASLAIARAHMDNRIHSLAELDSATGLKTLLAVPAVAPQTGRLSRVWQRHDDAVSYDDLLLEIERRGGRSKFSRAINRLLSYLTDLETRGQPRVILLTSSDADEGKSALALSLAFVAAGHGIRTLLVDANGADPRLTEVFNGRLRAGKLSDRVIADTQLRLSFLSLSSEGSIPLDRARRGETIDELRELAANYDLTIIDSGVLSEEPDASALIEASQAVIFVSRASAVARQSVSAAASDLLTIAKGRRCAAVLNMADEESCN